MTFETSNSVFHCCFFSTFSTIVTGTALNTEKSLTWGSLWRITLLFSVTCLTLCPKSAILRWMSGLLDSLLQDWKLLSLFAPLFQLHVLPAPAFLPLSRAYFLLDDVSRELQRGSGAGWLRGEQWVGGDGLCPFHRSGPLLSVEWLCLGCGISVK